jgi:hypothetical protein
VAYTPYDEPQPERPVIVTVIGILAIVAGALTLLSLPLSLLQFSGAMPMAGPGSQIVQDPTVRTWMIVSSTVGALLAGLQIVAGIGLLRLQRWGWLLAIGLLIFGVLWQVAITIAMQSMDIMGRMFAGMGAMGDANLTAMMERMATVMTIVGLVFWIVVYAVVLILLTLPSVRKAFDKG